MERVLNLGSKNCSSFRKTKSGSRVKVNFWRAPDVSLWSKNLTPQAGEIHPVFDAIKTALWEGTYDNSSQQESSQVEGPGKG